MGTLLVAAIIFIAVFTQSLTGFGVALVSMALLPDLLGIQVAAPLVALVALTLEGTLLLRYRLGLNLRAIQPLVVTALIGIPIGVWGLRGVDEKLLLAVSGMIIAGYAVYALFQFRLPDLRYPAWAYAAGFLAGLFGGAYNTSGPPVIVYGDCRRWSPSEFKANLQGFFLLNDLIVVLTHALNCNLSADVGAHFLWSLPAIGAGVIAGTRLEKRLDPAVFRKVVLVLLLGMGIRLVF